MKKEIKELWIHALRSGRYEQTKSALYNDGAHCCLGVLCDIHENVGWQELQHTPAMFKAAYCGAAVSDYLPKPLAEQLGIHFRPTVTLPHNWQEQISVEEIPLEKQQLLNTTLSNYGRKITLHTLNDGLDFTFSEIAALIEKFEVL
jgi:hypothetical protein